MKGKLLPKEYFFSPNTVFSQSSRKRCMANLKQSKLPQTWKPTGSSAPNFSVMIPICTVNNVASLLYTVRSPNLRVYNGQTAFPGGRMIGEETPMMAALRSVQEEIGMSPSRLEIWGHGAPLPARNDGALITPVIGTIADLEKQDLNVNRNEVSEVFVASLEVLCDPKNHFYTQFRNGYVLPVFIAEDYKIWGITAYLTHIFLKALMPEEVYKNEWHKKKIRMRKGNEFDPSLAQ